MLCHLFELSAWKSSWNLFHIWNYIFLAASKILTIDVAPWKLQLMTPALSRCHVYSINCLWCWFRYPENSPGIYQSLHFGWSELPPIWCLQEWKKLTKILHLEKSASSHCINSAFPLLKCHLFHLYFEMEILVSNFNLLWLSGAQKIFDLWDLDKTQYKIINCMSHSHLHLVLCIQFHSLPAFQIKKCPIGE